MQVVLEYSKKGNYVLIKPSFYGQNLGRWELIGSLALFCSEMGFFEVVGYKLSRSMVSFTLKVEHVDNNLLKDLLDVMIDMTFSFKRSGVKRFLAELVKRGENLQKIAEVVGRRIRDERKAMRELARELLTILFKEKKIFDAVMEVVKKGVISTDNGVRDSSLELFKVSFKKGLGFNAAIEATDKFFSVDNENIKMKRK